MTHTEDQNQTSTRIPAPLYAVAGAGDLALQQLRKLPAVVDELTDRAVAGTAGLRTKAAELRNSSAVRELDAAALRDIARRNGAAVLAGAQAAQTRAREVYTELVARGERVVGTGVVHAADTVNADMETTAPAGTDATPTPKEPAAASAGPAGTAPRSAS